MNPSSSNSSAFLDRSTSSASSSSSTTLATPDHARPRARRLRSATDSRSVKSASFDDTQGSQLSGPLSTIRPSRGVSPIPSRHPSRTTQPRHDPHSRSVSYGGALGGGIRYGYSAAPPASNSSLWEGSWSSLQGLASKFLSGDPTSDPTSSGAPASSPRQRSSRPDVARRIFHNAPLQWGPTASSALTAAAEDVGLGSPAARAALVRARRREDLLSSQSDPSADSLGNFKRRNSDDLAATPPSIPRDDSSVELDRGALVYVHRVRPSDTLAGVVIHYHCHPVAFRKANRLWPNDSIQTRKIVVLPVDACAIKGRPIPPSSACVLDEGLELGGQYRQNNAAAIGDYDDDDTSRATVPQLQPSPSLTSMSGDADSSEWTHHSYVLLPHTPEPVEIVRLPRRSLNHFPTRRRKSVSVSDLETPPASLELPRFPTSPRLSPALSASNDTSGRHESPRRTTRSDRSSESFANKLHGPGGVGRLVPGVSMPGPEMDGLNRLLGPHLPDVTPHEGEADSSAGPGLSTAGNALEELGGVVEGWVRRLASRAAAVVVETPGQARKGPAGGQARMGDCIELSDGLEGFDDGPPGRARTRDSTRDAGGDSSPDFATLAASNSRERELTRRRRKAD